MGKGADPSCGSKIALEVLPVQLQQINRHLRARHPLLCMSDYSGDVPRHPRAHGGAHDCARHGRIRRAEVRERRAPPAPWCGASDLRRAQVDDELRRLLREDLPSVQQQLEASPDLEAFLFELKDILERVSLVSRPTVWLCLTLVDCHTMVK